MMDLLVYGGSYKNENEVRDFSTSVFSGTTWATLPLAERVTFKPKSNQTIKSGSVSISKGLRHLNQRYCTSFVLVILYTASCLFVYYTLHPIIIHYDWCRCCLFCTTGQRCGYCSSDFWIKLSTLLSIPPVLDVICSPPVMYTFISRSYGSLKNLSRSVFCELTVPLFCTQTGNSISPWWRPQKGGKIGTRFSLFLSLSLSLSLSVIPCLRLPFLSASHSMVLLCREAGQELGTWRMWHWGTCGRSRRENELNCSYVSFFILFL